ncbi:MAG: hypothetical protein E4H02_05030 [Lentisphaerales bacterium]|nr:MAG: hypothetical protein E4H02_05030 [Lentisphaerales bacterium]
MNKGFAIAAIAITAFALAVVPETDAARFQDEFQLLKITGTCEAKLPSARESDAAIEGKMYPYGTTLKTGADSSAILRLSSGNGFRVFAKTTIVIAESGAGSRTKILKLDAGSVQVVLEPSFRKENELKVETPSAVCTAIGCDFTVEYYLVGDLKTTIVTCAEGEVSIDETLFSLSGLTEDEQLTVSESPDGTFVRIKVVKGDVSADVLESDSGKRRLEMATGDELEIMTKQADSNPDRIDVVYKFAPLEGELVVISTQLGKVESVIMGPTDLMAAPEDWPNVTVVTPTIWEQSYTPVGRR